MVENNEFHLEAKEDGWLLDAGSYWPDWRLKRGVGGFSAAELGKLIHNVKIRP